MELTKREELLYPLLRKYAEQSNQNRLDLQDSIDFLTTKMTNGKTLNNLGIEMELYQVDMALLKMYDILDDLYKEIVNS